MIQMLIQCFKVHVSISGACPRSLWKALAIDTRPPPPPIFVKVFATDQKAIAIIYTDKKAQPVQGC